MKLAEIIEKWYSEYLNTEIKWCARSSKRATRKEGKALKEVREQLDKWYESRGNLEGAGIPTVAMLAQNHCSYALADLVYIALGAIGKEK